MEKLHEFHGWCASDSLRTMMFAIPLLTFAAGGVGDLRAEGIPIPWSSKIGAPSARPRDRIVTSVGRRSQRNVVNAGLKSIEISNQGVVLTAQRVEDDDTFDQLLSSPSAVDAPQSGNLRGTSKQSEKDVEDFNIDFDQDEAVPPAKKRIEKKSTDTFEQEAKSPDQSKPIKLRKRYDTGEPKLVKQADERGTDTKSNAPRISPKSSEQLEGGLESEPGRIVGDSEFFEDGRGESTGFESLVPDQSNSQPLIISRSTEDVPASRFPKEKVVELKQRMESALALNPGELAGTAKSEPIVSSIVDVSPEEKNVQNRRVRLRKRQQKPAEDHSYIAEANNKSRESKSGQGTLIQWRSANSDAKATNAASKSETKSIPLVQDLRQSVRDGALAGQETNSELKPPIQSTDPNSDPSQIAIADRQNHAELTTKSARANDSSSRSQIRASLWDHAAPPSDSDYSGTIGGTGKMMDAQSVNLGYAPKPPSDPVVEQVSFDKPAELFGRRTSAKEASRAAGDHEGRQIASVEEDVKGAKTKDHDSRSESIAAKGPFGWISRLFGIPLSTGSIIFGVAGAALCVAGIWVVHETIRSKNS